MGLWVTLFVIQYPMPTGFLVVLTLEAVFLVFVRLTINDVQSERGLQRVHFQLLLVELVCHTALFYLVGGVSWLGIIAYVYALMYAAVFLTPRQAAVFTGAVIAACLSVVALDGTGTIPHQWYLPQGADRYRDPEFLIATSIGFAGVAGTVTFWMVFLGTEIRRERDGALRANAELLETQKDLQRLNETLERKVEERTRALAWRAEHDQLTGLLNREAVTRRAQELLALARRGGRSLCVIIADCDGFKRCNDEAGHAYGDEVLRETARCLLESCRESDVVGRLGGDEFMIVLPDTSAKGALRYGRRLLKEIKSARDAWELTGPPFPTMSLGVAVFPQRGSDVQELARDADQAMYEAKAAGGCRVTVAGTGVSLPRPRPGRAPTTA
jgi:diguanylate cyclase (GGDEF)-like protein